MLVHVGREALEQVAPGDGCVVRACGRGHAGWPGRRRARLPQPRPGTLARLGASRDNGGLVVRVTRVLPPEVVGMGSGRVSAVTSVALQTGPRWSPSTRWTTCGWATWSRCASGMRPTTPATHEDSITIGVVTTGDSPVSGNGPGVTLLLSGSASALAVEIDEGANLADLLGIA